jgi:X-Pro dipeptidyl-peptidase
MRWGIAVIVAVLVGAAPAQAQQVQRCDGGTPSFAPTTRPAKYAIGAQETVELESARDGVAIDVAFFRPKVPAGTKVPVIVNATPYHHAQPTLDVRRCKPYFVENYVPQGYAVAFVAVRGTGNSGGCMDLFGPGEGDDVSQAVTWLGTREWSTGSVGMIGKSYEGGTQWEVAARGNPHLKTIVPVAGVPDVFSLMYEGGNIDFRGPLLLNDLYYGPSVVTYADGRPPERTLEVAACPDYATGNAAAAESSVTGLPDSFGYWAARRYRREIERNYKGSVLLVQGFEDLNVPPGNQFPWIQRLDVPLKQMWGQWGHSNPDTVGREDWHDIVLTWFDRYLKGEDVDTGPAAEIEDSQGQWRTADRWPPRTKARRFRLAAGTHVLAPDPVHTYPGTLGMPATPLDAACPAPNCVAYTLARGELRFAGRPLLRLRVTPAADAGHVSAYLFAGQQRIGWGQADVRFPDDDGRRKPVTPGRTITLKLSLQPLDSVVPAGQPMTLVLSQGAAYDRIPSVPTAPMAVSGGSLRVTPLP